MHNNGADSWWDRAKTLIAAVSLLVAVIVFVFGSGFVYDHFINVPDLTYAKLPARHLKTQSLGGVFVENRGRATAHEVLINLGDLGATIDEYYVGAAEETEERGGGMGETTLIVWLKRMASGSSVTIYVLTSDDANYDSVNVTSDEQPGREVGVGTGSIGNVAYVAVVAASIGVLIANFFIAFVAGSFFEHWLGQRR
jgi:hypothetical protein